MMLENSVENCQIELHDVEALKNIASNFNQNEKSDKLLLEKYKKQLNIIHDFLVSSGHQGLFQLSEVLSEGLKQLIDENRSLTRDECNFLKKVPEIFSEYIFIPSSKISDAHLLSHLKNPTWVRPLTEEEDKKITALLIKKNDAENENISIDTIDVDGDELDLNDFMEKNSDIIEKSDDLIIAEDFQDNSVSSESLISSEGNVVDKNYNVNYPISQDQQELVDLVCYELTDIIEDELIDVININDQSELKESLINMAEQVENISNAVDLIGLEGLGDTCRYISSNIHLLALKENVLLSQHKEILDSWAFIIREYLQNIATVTASNSLLSLLKNKYWPDPINSEIEYHLEQLLKKPEFKKEEKKQRQITAVENDISLQLPNDVNADLLDALLQDLPVQTEEFSSAIQNLQSKKNIEYLEIAQRIAHTLKGAGNVVGVKGIANLTHHLEDILEIHSKAKKLPCNKLLDLLVDSADCLEAMSETLLGIDDAPDNSLLLFQSVLDWANILDEKGVDNTELDYSNNHNNFKFIENKHVKATMEEKPGNNETKTLENTLRVPAKLVDDLLRLAGENLISTSQIQEYIKTIQQRYKILKNHNNVLQKLSFDLEHIVDIQGLSSHSVEQQLPIGEFDSLELDQYHELHSMSRRLIEVAADSIEISKVLEKDFLHLSSLVITQGQLQKENEAMVLKTRMIPTRTIISRLKRGVKQVCRLTNKYVDLEVIDNGTYMDSEVLSGLIEPLMHILRNAVDHGIELKEVREIANKAIRGRIVLIFERKGDHIVIDIQDDGKGLSLTKIREKAHALGLVDNINEVNVNNMQNYIVKPGFTTRNDANHVSGRGIGLDVVYSKIRELKGSIDITSEEGKGCRFLLSLPISSFSVHSLLVRVRKNVVAISNRGIEEILYPGLGELKMIGQKVMFKLGEQVYDTQLIESLLNLSEDRRKDDRAGRPVVLVKDDNGAVTAVLVQEVIDSRDVVVKSMGEYIPKIQGIVGATVLGDGSICSVIDLPELMQTSIGSSMVQLDEGELNDSRSINKQSYILVVDDSLSARKSLAQFVKDLGVEVRTARDGMEAIELIDKRMPDLLLVDMEMPRMNGLELTTHIRTTENIRHLPIIMITSRSTEKHRKVAMDKGVTHYMVKPFGEDELAKYINAEMDII